MHAWAMGGMGGGGEVVQGSKMTGDVVVRCAPPMGMGSVREVCMHGCMHGRMEPREAGARYCRGGSGSGREFGLFLGWREVCTGRKVTGHVQGRG